MPKHKIVELHIYIIAILGSALAGAINTMAGNGSAITLTILTELIGLPGNVANGTNRVGVMMQCTASTYAFHKNGRLKVKRSWHYILFTVIGAVIGIIVAIWVSNEQFISIFRIIIVLMLFVILIKPKRWLRETDPNKKVNLWIIAPLFLAMGFYGGFIQMGMGIIFLALMVLGARYSLMDSNIIKSFIVGLYTIVALVIFHSKGLIDWKIGGIMAVGQTAGGYFMANFASKYPSANLWAHRLLVFVVILAIVKLFNLHLLFM